MPVNILGYNIFSESKEELLKYITECEKKLNIISGNPEILYNGLNNEYLYNNFTGNNSIIMPDGVGTVISSKIVGHRVKEKIAGIEFMAEILKYCSENAKGIYLLGAKEDVLNKCIDNLKVKYPKLIISGKHNGFFNIENCKEVLEDIKCCKGYAIFVAMGSPRQELFISKYMEELPCRIFMGVGGSFDVIAGNVKRAPKWMISLGIEWLYRVIKEPWRIKRLSSIPKFLWKVFLNTNFSR